MSRVDVVGFDYAQAILELSHKYTYQQIARAIGYASKGSIKKILSEGTVPSHIIGEALWDLYIDTFGRKPKLRATKSTMPSV